MFGSCGRLLFLIHDRCQLDPAHDLSLPVNVWLPTDTSAMFPPATNVLNSLQSILDLLQRMDRITAQIARITYQMENESFLFNAAASQTVVEISTFQIRRDRRRARPSRGLIPRGGSSRSLSRECHWQCQ